MQLSSQQATHWESPPGEVKQVSNAAMAHTMTASRHRHTCPSVRKHKACKPTSHAGPANRLLAGLASLLHPQHQNVDSAGTWDPVLQKEVATAASALLGASPGPLTSNTHSQHSLLLHTSHKTTPASMPALLPVSRDLLSTRPPPLHPPAPPPAAAAPPAAPAAPRLAAAALRPAAPHLLP